MTRRAAASLLTLSCLLLAGCDIVGVACTDEAVPGLRVAVLDAGSGDAVDGALVVARDGSWADSVRIGRNVVGNPVLLATERAGVYDVTAEAEGYHTRRREGVVVTEDECHVRTEDVVLSLPPEG